MQICIECKDFDLDKTCILQNNIILAAIRTCIKEDKKVVLANFPCYFSLSPRPLLPLHPSTAYVIDAARKIVIAFRCCHLHKKAAIELYHF